jgi:HD-like signal output (HDOD) protein
MALERREHLRYEPTSPVGVLLIWHDASGDHQAAAQLRDLSEGGCAFLADQPPPLDTLTIARLALMPGQPPVTLKCHAVALHPAGGAVRISAKFSGLTGEQLAQLSSALTSGAYRPQHAEINLERRKHWRLPQWTAYLTAQRLPVMPRSKLALHALEAEKGGDLTVDELVALANADPFLCLCLLREAEEKRSSRLGHETATQFAAVMQLGATAFRELLITSPEADETHIGLAECEARAVLAGQLAAAWSSSRADASPDEVLMAALLSEIGELLLWHFAPELPESAKEMLETGKAARSAEAQEAICGFKFQDLTVTCAEAWKLPPILIQLIRGHDNVRARIARLSRNTARHLVTGPDNPALPDDLAKAKQLLPQASMEYLVAGLRQIPPEMQPDLVDRANQALHKVADA